MLSFFHYTLFALLSISANSVTAPPPARLIYQFPVGTVVENIATRSNGHLLLSVISAPILYELDPTSSTPCPKVVHTFPYSNGMSGIAQTNTPDVYAITAGNWTVGNFTGYYESFSVWIVDFRPSTPSVSMLARIPDSNALNGLAVHRKRSSNTILVSDSAKGGVWSIDIKTGNVKMAMTHKDFAPGQYFPLGINGISTDPQGRFLHFVNSAQGIYGRIPIGDDGSAMGAPEHLATLAAPEVYDDFIFDKNGDVLIATHPGSVYKVTKRGDASLYANSTVLQPTSIVFGKGSKKEEATLYLSTSGSGQVGGQVVALDDYDAAVEEEEEEKQEPSLSRWGTEQHVLAKEMRNRWWTEQQVLAKEMRNRWWEL